MQSIQFTMEQVADYLGLPASAVKRLAIYFNIPQNICSLSRFNSETILFQASDIKMLKKIQHLLIAGKTLEEIACRFKMSTTLDNAVISSDYTYDSDKHEREILKRRNMQQRFPLMSLVTTLEKERFKGNNLQTPLLDKKESALLFPVMSPLNSWQASAVFKSKKF